MQRNNKMIFNSTVLAKGKRLIVFKDRQEAGSKYYQTDVKCWLLHWDYITFSELQSVLSVKRVNRSDHSGPVSFLLFNFCCKAWNNQTQLTDCVCLYEWEKETLVMCLECGGSAALTHSWELGAAAAPGLGVIVRFRQEMKG